MFRNYNAKLWNLIFFYLNDKGIIITILLIEYAGRRICIAVEYAVFALFVLLLNICVSRNLMIFFIFVARCFISGAFQAIYVYTPVLEN